MKLNRLYNKAVTVGIAQNQRGKKESNRILREEKACCEVMKKEKRNTSIKTGSSIPTRNVHPPRRSRKRGPSVSQPAPQMSATRQS